MYLHHLQDNIPFVVQYLSSHERARGAQREFWVGLVEGGVDGEFPVALLQEPGLEAFEIHSDLFSYKYWIQTGWFLKG